MINWASLADSPARVERAIKLLIRELYQDAQGIDGSGGDDGRDVWWESPSGLIIFEVKSHVRLLEKSQKRQIAASLRSAARHRPVEWRLLIPRDPTPGEKSWFDGLRAQFSAITLTWFGRDWLDGQFARYEHLRAYVEGPDYGLLVRARELALENTVPATGLDYIQRRQQLDERASNLSPFWRVNQTIEGNTTVLRYVPRYPGDEVLDPVELRSTFAFPQDNPEAQEIARQFVHTMNYGGDVTIPGCFIDSFHVEASEASRRLFDMGNEGPLLSLQYSSISDDQGLPLPLTLNIVNAEGVIAASITAQLNRRVGGGRGSTLSGGDASGLLNVACRVERPADGRIDFKLDLTCESVVGHWPQAVRPFADFVLAAAPGMYLSACMGSRESLLSPIEDGDLSEFVQPARLIAALDEVQRAVGQRFVIPDGLKWTDVLELEMLQELFRTGRSRWPYSGINTNIRSDKLREFLADEALRQPGHMVIESAVAFDFGGNRIAIGPTRTWGGLMELSNRSELESLVGAVVDAQARWRSVDGEDLYIQQLDAGDS